jgi:hypothetical protein
MRPAFASGTSSPGIGRCPLAVRLVPGVECAAPELASPPLAYPTLAQHDRRFNPDAECEHGCCTLAAARIE